MFNQMPVFVSILIVDQLCVKSVSQGMQMAYQQGEMAYGVDKSSVNVEDSWGFAASNGASFIFLV